MQDGVPLIFVQKLLELLCTCSPTHVPACSAAAVARALATVQAARLIASSPDRCNDTGLHEFQRLRWTCRLRFRPSTASMTLLWTPWSTPGEPQLSPQLGTVHRTLGLACHTAFSCIQTVMMWNVVQPLRALTVLRRSMGANERL